MSESCRQTEPLPTAQPLPLEETILKRESQNTALTMRLARAYGVIGQLAHRLSDNYYADFGEADISAGLESCRVTDDGRTVKVSTLGS